MFDFEELWEPKPDDPKGEAYENDEALGPDRIRVVARHATNGLEFKIVLPKRAKFKHIKRVLARRLACPEVLTKAQLLDKIEGLYTAYRDQDPVGDVRQVMVLGVDLSVAEGSRMVATLSDGEVSEDESAWCTVEYVGGSSKALAPAASASTKPRTEPSQVTHGSSSSTQGRGSGRPAGKAAAAMLREGVLDGLGPRLPQGGVAGLARGSKPLSAAPAQLKASHASGPTLTKSEAMHLQQELYEGFRADEFQQELRALHCEEAAMPRTEFIKARQDLFFAVQCQVLPRYGFEETQEGVYKMMAAMGPFIKDPDFVQLARRVNALVGVENPPERWGSLQQACEKWDFVEGSPRRALQ
mmetsp:Transcript_50144/g.160463  ORF Transcript_50144/g.160463 Transcript_50144/m.160463 type:complete len:356 (-) Transcript_50144:100-1167(-)